MHEFLNLVLKVAFSHLYRDPEIREASQLYDSFFPKKQENMVFYGDPNDQATQEFKYKILTYMNNYVLSHESLPTKKVDGADGLDD
jgi:hypothetical protein